MNTNNEKYNEILQKYKDDHDEPDFDFAFLDKAILNLGKQINGTGPLYHGGDLREGYTIKALSTTKNIDLAINHFLCHSNSLGAYGKGECSVYKFDILESDIIAYTYGQGRHGRSDMPSEEEVIFPSGMYIAEIKKEGIICIAEAFEKYHCHDENRYKPVGFEARKKVNVVLYTCTLAKK